MNKAEKQNRINELVAQKRKLEKTRSKNYYLISSPRVKTIAIKRYTEISIIDAEILRLQIGDIVVHS